MTEVDQDDIKKLSDDEVFVMSLKCPDLFSEIMDRYQSAFIRKAKEILHDEEDAYDAVQEAFVRIYSAARTYRKQENASFKSWAYKILTNQCFTMYQKKKKLYGTSSLSDEFSEVLPDKREAEAYENKLDKDYLMSLLSRLPLILARVVTLHFIDEVPQKKIAQQEGVSNEVVRTRIHRAKKELKKISLQAF